MQALQTRFDTAQREYYEAFSKALEGKDTEKMTQADWEAVQGGLKPIAMEEFQAEVQALLAENDSDSAAFDALLWSMANDSQRPENAQRCLAILEAKHMQSERMAEVCSSRMGVNADFLKRVIQATPHSTVRWSAQMALAEQYREDARMAERLATSTAEERQQYEGWMGAERIAAITKADPKQLEADAVALYEAVAEAADPQSEAGQDARRELYELRNLAVGMPAPEIEGPDLDGVAFKLSDYRGKVVLLDFWGNW